MAVGSRKDRYVRGRPTQRRSGAATKCGVRSTPDGVCPTGFPSFPCVWMVHVTSIEAPWETLGDVLSCKLQGHDGCRRAKLNRQNDCKLT